MGIPLRQQLRVGAYVLKQRLLGRDRYPLVLMLEPLFRFNLDTSIYRVCGEVEVAGWRAGMARPSAAVGFGGAVAGAAG